VGELVSFAKDEALSTTGGLPNFRILLRTQQKVRRRGGLSTFGVDEGASNDDTRKAPQPVLRRIELYFPLSHGVPRVDDQRIISEIIFVIRNGLRWRDAPKEYGPHKTIYNRFIRWSRLGVFNRIFAALSAKGGKPDRLMTTKLGKYWTGCGLSGEL
jgi:transposase